MKLRRCWILVVVPLAACLQLAGCKQATEDAEEHSSAEVEHSDDAESGRLTLTEDEGDRLGIQTETVRESGVEGARHKVIPYDAILYDAEGNTWTYTNPEPHTYVRVPVVVDHIVQEQAVLTDGPPAGTPVVIVGAAELYGSEIEFEEE